MRLVFVQIENWGWCLRGTGVSPVKSWARRPCHFWMDLKLNVDKALEEKDK